MPKTRYFQARGFIEWAKVFEHNRDMGDNTDHKGVSLTIKKADGIYSLNFYPANEAIKDKMTASGVSDTVFGGGDRWREGNESLGVGQYMTFKRKHKDVREVNGEEINFGGPPRIVDLGPDLEGRDEWDSEELLGNGTEILLNYSVYGEGDSATIRFADIGVINAVKYDPDKVNF